MRKAKAASDRSARSNSCLNGELRIGISGWTYKPWRGVFYPPNHPQKRELEYASRAFNTIEINGTFYSLQRPGSFQKWYSEMPAGFVFSVKGARFITHMKKLRDVAAPLAIFLASGILSLRGKLGPILWQFPPNFGWNENRFREFFEMLPRHTEEAVELAKQHNEKLKGRAWTKTDACQPLRYAVEIRHPSFLVPEFYALLREYQIAFVIADTTGNGPTPRSSPATSSITGCMVTSSSMLVATASPRLKSWARRIRRWRRGRDIFVYFDNDAKVHAPFDAQRLARFLA